MDYDGDDERLVGTLLFRIFVDAIFGHYQRIDDDELLDEFSPEQRQRGYQQRFAATKQYSFGERYERPLFNVVVVVGCGCGCGCGDGSHVGFHERKRRSREQQHGLHDDADEHRRRVRLKYDDLEQQQHVVQRRF